MVVPVILYISAASDLDDERDILGRAVTEVPVDVSWRIGQSPRRNNPIDGETLSKADLHLLLLGGDIRAPVGLEWLTARRAGRMPLPFLKQGARRTPAAREFVRYIEAQTEWRPFKDASELRRAMWRLLGDYLLRQAAVYALSHVELERLRAWRTGLESAPASAEEQPQGGAGESSVILSEGRFVPSEGVLIEPDIARRGDSLHPYDA